MFKRLPINRGAVATLELYWLERHVGNFTGHHIDTDSAQFKQLLLRRQHMLAQKDRRRVANPRTVEDIEFVTERNVDLFLDTEALIGWEIEGEDGKPVPFTRENVRAFLLHPDYRWAFREIEQFFLDEANFTDQPLADAVGEPLPT